MTIDTLLSYSFKLPRRWGSFCLRCFSSSRTDHPTRGTRVTYSSAFSAPMGGGLYNRQVRVGEWVPSFQRGVTQNKPDRDAAPLDPLDASLGDAVNAWHTYLSVTCDPAPFGVIGGAQGDKQSPVTKIIENHVMRGPTNPQAGSIFVQGQVLDLLRSIDRVV